MSSTEVDTREVYSVVMAELSRYNDTISGIGIIILYPYNNTKY